MIWLYMSVVSSHESHLRVINNIFNSTVVKNILREYVLFMKVGLPTQKLWYSCYFLQRTWQFHTNATLSKQRRESYIDIAQERCIVFVSLFHVTRNFNVQRTFQGCSTTFWMHVAIKATNWYSSSSNFDRVIYVLNSTLD